VYALKLLVTLTLAVLVHLAGTWAFPELTRFLDVFLVVVALHALEGNSLSALLIGLVFGLAYDTLTGGPFGLFGFANTLVGYGTARLAQRLVIQRATGVLAVVSLASVAQQAVAVGLAFLLLPDPSLPNPVGVALKVGACGVLGMLLHVLRESWQRSSETRRRSRMGRLRMG
jgi:rod shape-determining protein MreD